jgi:hypothetical protein
VGKKKKKPPPSFPFLSSPSSSQSPHSSHPLLNVHVSKVIKGREMQTAIRTGDTHNTLNMPVGIAKLLTAALEVDPHTAITHAKQKRKEK